MEESSRDRIAILVPESQDWLRSRTPEACSMRPDWKRWLIVPLLLAWAPGASADDNDSAKVISECGAQDLPQSSIDSCLERVRVLEETDASANLQGLEAALERRASGKGSIAHAEQIRTLPPELSTPAKSVRMTDPSGASDEDAPANSRPLAGPDVDDQPPIADSDDEATSQSDNAQQDDPQ